jgi:hypothetical protein
VGVDHHDDADLPSGKPSDHPPSRPPSETRSREEYYANARASTTWEETAELSRWMWTEYKRRWPPEEHASTDRSNDPPGSWRSESGMFLDSAVNDRIERECDNIAEREKEKISPALRDTESCDPGRRLIGFEHRLKGRDRLKEKVAKGMDENSLSPNEALAFAPDAIRYTFQYDETRYTDGVREDIVRMKDRGFELCILKNSWSADQYKGINSQWIEPESGQRFELQFHTRISFEAKQITHDSYERLRSGQPDPFEHMVLEAFQAKVAVAVSIPPGAADIPEYPQRDQNAR